MMSYDVDFKTLQISVKESKIWVNIPQCVLRIQGLDPDWIHKLSIYKPEDDLMNELSPQYEPSKAYLGQMIDVRIPKTKMAQCDNFDCIHNKFPVGRCQSNPNLVIVKQGLFQCKNYKDCLG